MQMHRLAWHVEWAGKQHVAYGVSVRLESTPNTPNTGQMNISQPTNTLLAGLNSYAIVGSVARSLNHSLNYSKYTSGTLPSTPNLLPSRCRCSRPGRRKSSTSL